MGLEGVEGGAGDVRGQAQAGNERSHGRIRPGGPVSLGDGIRYELPDPVELREGLLGMEAIDGSTLDPD